MADLGDRVQDIISKQTGIVVAKTYWLYGCIRLCIQPEEAKGGKPTDTFVIDEPQAKVLKGRVIKEVFVVKETIPEVRKEKINLRVEKTHGNSIETIQ